MEPIQGCLDPVVARILRQAPPSPARLECAWRLAVGPELARISTVTTTAGVLSVTLPDRRWAQEFRRSIPLVLERLQRMLGDEEVRRIEIHVVERRSPDEAAQARRRAQEASRG